MKYPPVKKQITFVAIPLPPSLIDQLLAIQKQLTKLNHPIVWERPEKLHITFLYLGKLSQSKTRRLSSILKHVAGQTPPITAQVGYLDYFFKKHEQGVVWIGVQSSQQQLEQLHKHLVKALNHEGFSLSNKKLIPHITLGRLKKVRQQQMAMLSELTDLDLPLLDTLIIDQLVVFTSQYQRGFNTTEYHELARVSFKLT